MSDLAKAEALLAGGRVHPSDPAYRKPNMPGRTEALFNHQYPEYTAWLAKRKAS